MKIKNIIWDWNGTLVDDAYLFVDIMNLTLERHGLPQIDLHDYKNKFCFPIKNYWNLLGFSFNNNTFNVMNKEFLRLYQQKMHEPLLQKGARIVLDHFHKRNFQQFVLSASEHKVLNSLIIKYNINHYFSDILGVDNLNALGKENLGRFLIKKHLLNPDETVVVGDTEYDFRVANSLGCHCVLVSCGHFSRSRLLGSGREVVASVQDILKLF